MSAQNNRFYHIFSTQKRRVWNFITI